MLARIRKSMNEKDQGFTLIELLVVMIIIGILAAIAIPVFLNQRKKAVDSSMKSDLKTVATALETSYTDNGSYPTVTTGSGTLTVSDQSVKLSPDNTIAVTATGSGTGYCILATNAKASHAWVYKSEAGGLQPGTTTTC